MSISKTVRRIVIERAGNRCEYCHLPQAISNYEFHIEHIISIQHGGQDTLNNLAWCCAFCNWKKGPNIGTLVNGEQGIVPLYNPRTQPWADHFEIQDGLIIPLSVIGIGTSNLLEFNLPERVEVRSILYQAGFYS